jgi:hypothetical protein
MTLSGDGTITGLVAGGLPDATVTADDLASGAAVSNIGYTPTNQQAENINFRNRIINGDMRIDQRNAGAAVTLSANAFVTDRFQINGSSGMVAAAAPVVQQSTDAPSGFVNSLIYTNTNAAATLTGLQSISVLYKIEGSDITDLGWGTASAKAVTFSFWVRSSLTGTFGGSLQNSAANRSYPFTYSVSVADTWEYKTVTIPGETTGTWLTTTGVGINVRFSLGAGPDRRGTAGAWNSNSNFGATGQVQLIETAGATFYITGVQLEVGSVATPFERRPYGTELALCQRYYAKTYPQATVPGTATYNGTIMVPCFGSMAYAGGTWQLPVTMRASPTVVLYSTINANTTGKLTADATDGNGVSDSSDRNIRYNRDNDSSGIGLNVFLHFQGTASAEL